MKNIILGLLVGFILTTTYFFFKDLGSFEYELPNRHVAVRIIIDTYAIDSIILTSEHSIHSVDIGNQNEIVIVFPNPGEGSFSLCCVFSDGRKLCDNEQYVEAGYKPTLKIKEDTIEVVDYGFGY